MKYTIKDAVILVRKLEANLAEACGCHFALGGSTIMKGESGKDFDILVYPDKGQHVNHIALILGLSELGIMCDLDHTHKPSSNQPCQEIAYPDKPILFLHTHDGFRIDMFLMSCMFVDQRATDLDDLKNIPNTF